MLKLFIDTYYENASPLKWEQGEGLTEMFGIDAIIYELNTVSARGLQ